MIPEFIIIMGVAGSGKTTVGKALADKLGWDFYDADDFHPPTNVEKMANNMPLTDDDRIPWLDSLNVLISSCLKKNRPGVLACSALKERYRQILLTNNPNVLIVYLQGNYDLILARMSARTGHYMQTSMLQGQFDALEEPSNAITLDIAVPINILVESILNSINNDSKSITGA
jgi:gluconokinase